MSVFQRALFWLKTASDLGQLYLLSRRPHIEEDLPRTLADEPWVVLATKRPIRDDAPVYATPAYKPVSPGDRFWVFVEEGEYWLYALPGTDPEEILRKFYANPAAAMSLDSPVVSERGFRAEVEELA